MWIGTLRRARLRAPPYVALLAVGACLPLDSRILKETEQSGSLDAGGSDATSPASGHCRPGKFEPTPFRPGGPGKSCPDVMSCPGVPNREATSMNDIALSTPAVGGKPYALSVAIEAEGRLQTLEIWGADDRCGAAKELLWWAPLSSQILCAEFVPKETYTHLLYVLRNQSISGDTSVKSLAMTLCPTGSCPRGSDGHSAAEGGELVAPIGPYLPKGSGSFPGPWQWDIGPDGHMMFVTTEASGDGVANVVTGVFRTARDDPFGDAWYCIGEGSTFSFEGAVHPFSLKNITRLASCKEHPGAGITTFSLTGSYANVTSTFASLTDPSLYTNPGACLSNECWFTFTEQGVFSPLQVFTREDFGVPTGTEPAEGTIDEASWLKVPDDGGPLSLWCGASGSLHYELLGTSNVEISAMSGPFKCPGEPVPRSTFEGRFE